MGGVTGTAEAHTGVVDMAKKTRRGEGAGMRDMKQG